MNLVAQTAKREFDVMIAVPSGPGGTELAKIQKERQQRYWDVHSGTNETSTAQALFPELLEMWRLPEDWKPSNNMTKELKEMRNPDREDWEVVSQVFGACAEPDTDDFTTDGVYGWNSPLDADPDEAAARIEERVEFIAEFIRRWKKIPTPPAFDV
jgi:creatinine amidohydrolase/Fe(II)-dependent formamide hydrolase-like protein